jgi:hypothetical protein
MAEFGEESGMGGVQEFHIVLERKWKVNGENSLSYAEKA